MINIVLFFYLPDKYDDDDYDDYDDDDDDDDGDDDNDDDDDDDDNDDDNDDNDDDDDEWMMMIKIITFFLFAKCMIYLTRLQSSGQGSVVLIVTKHAREFTLPCTLRNWLIW